MSREADIVFEEVSYCYPHSEGGNLPENRCQGTTNAAASTGAGTALSEVSLTVERGEFIAVIGANGSGKSTLARHINALLLPSGGRVLVVGFDSSDPNTAFTIRSHAGMIFQNPNTQIIASIVADDVAFGPENLNIEHSELVGRVSDALDQVGMLPFAEADPSQLSGGQKQRVAIAGILAMHPDVLVLDEPGAMLDVRGRRGIRRVVRELNASGMTVVLITHFMEEAVLAKRVVVMDGGRIALDGQPAEVFSDPDTLRQLGLGIPFSMRLAEALIARGLPVPQPIRPEELKELLCSWY
ncbi:MAG: energy-coupling factor transporter ATPase [Actinomycetia bacterium]|nr:energy-coupling factor transporter ATPase [Actinomycetes bacterium]